MTKQIKALLNQKPPLTKAVVAFLLKDNNVLLGLRKKVSNGLGDQLISGIGGKVDPDETYEDTLIREIAEEIEVKVEEFEDRGRVRFLFPHNPKWQQDVRIFVVTKWEGEPKETDPIKPLWFNKNNLPKDKMWDDNSYWVANVLNGEKIDGVFLYEENGKVSEFILK